jgi:hypothetical protein
MQKTIGSDSSKALGQDMLHQQVKEVLSGNCSCPIFIAFGVDISKGDFSVFAAKDVFFLDDAFIQIFAEVDDRFVSVAHMLTVDNPLFWGIGRYSQILINDCFQQLCPEYFSRVFLNKEIFGRFCPP